MTKRLELIAGQHFGEWVLDEPLGRGSFSEVWSAHHKVLAGRRAAIKVPFDPQDVSRLAREGRLLERVSGPHIVGLVGLDPNHDPPYLALELIVGETLRERLRRDGRLAPQETKSLMIQIARGLEVAHQHDIVHRDLKPENVLLDADGRAYVADFGLGKFSEAATHEGLLSNSLKTGEGSIAGTLRYMAPEQRDPELEVDTRADLYALGVILFEALTGSAPCGPEVPSDVRTSLDPRWDALYKRLCTRVERRVRSAAEVIAELEAVQGTRSSVTKAPTRNATGDDNHLAAKRFRSAANTESKGISATKPPAKSLPPRSTEDDSRRVIERPGAASKAIKERGATKTAKPSAKPVPLRGTKEDDLRILCFLCLFGVIAACLHNTVKWDTGDNQPDLTPLELGHVSSPKDLPVAARKGPSRDTEAPDPRPKARVSGAREDPRLKALDTGPAITGAKTISSGTFLAKVEARDIASVTYVLPARLLLIELHVDKENLRGVREVSLRVFQELLLAPDIDEFVRQNIAGKFTVDDVLLDGELDNYVTQRIHDQRRWWWIGASERAVRNSQGAPDSISGQTWYYGQSRVSFWRGQAVSYDQSPENELNLRSPVEVTGGTWTTGSTQKEVLAAEGMPSRVTGRKWYFDNFSITFFNGRVEAYFSSPGYKPRVR